nr:MAG TPA: hypothetical protein [Caudoviricetes sp.]DAS89315.1 MAG TPA: hypothetical protein [Caudoviricetes sp.]
MQKPYRGGRRGRKVKKPGAHFQQLPALTLFFLASTLFRFPPGIVLFVLECDGVKLPHHRHGQITQ